MPLIPTPPPPYYAVIFSSLRTGNDGPGYEEMGERMAELASQQPGYLGHESVRGGARGDVCDGLGITVSYWESLAAIQQWKHQSEHLFAQQQGRDRWYEAYQVRICRVERAYVFD